MDDFSLTSLPSEVKSKQNQCLIKVSVVRFWLGDMTGFIDHSARILVNPLQSWEFPPEPCWRRGTGHQRLRSEMWLQVKQLQEKWEKCPGLVLFSLSFCPLRVVCGLGRCCRAILDGHLETSPGWRRSGQLPLWVHFLPLRSKKESKKIRDQDKASGLLSPT